MRSLVAALMLCAGVAAGAWGLAPYRAPFDGMPGLDVILRHAELPAGDAYRPGHAGENAGEDAGTVAGAAWSPPAGFVAELPLPPHRPRADLLIRAEQYVGTNPTGWQSLWCARFIAWLRPDLARLVGNPNWARDWAEALPRTADPQPGDIVVLKRGRAGHIGILKRFDNNGDPVLVSGNTSGRRGHRVVAEGRFAKSRVIAYVMPVLP